jgi:hypothetical protein
VGTNRFSYSFNDPVNKFDPGGNQSVSIGTGLSDFFKSLFSGGPTASNQTSTAKAESNARAVGREMVNRTADAAKAAARVTAAVVLPDIDELTNGSITLNDGIEIAGLIPGAKLIGWGVDAIKACRKGADISGIAKRVDEIHSVLDTKAARHRTTGVLETTDGTRIVAGGVRDLSPAQRAALADGEIAAKQSGAYAEITALDKAAELGLSPSALATSWDICPDCANAIRNLGGVIIDARTAIWK